jgi:hypothetical protein
MNKIFNVQIRIQGPIHECRTFHIVARTPKAALIVAMENISEEDNVVWSCCELSFQVFETNQAFVL